MCVSVLVSVCVGVVVVPLVVAHGTRQTHTHLLSTSCPPGDVRPAPAVAATAAAAQGVCEREIVCVFMCAGYLLWPMGQQPFVLVRVCVVAHGSLVFAAGVTSMDSDEGWCVCVFVCACVCCLRIVCL